MSTILVKRWRDTTKLTRRSDLTLNSPTFEAAAKAVIDQIEKDRISDDRGGIVWAQVQIDARVIVLEEIEDA